MKQPTEDAVEREIAGLDSLDITALQNRWRELFGVEPPIKIRSGFLKYAIAYRLQELVFGGMKPETRRYLRKVAQQMRARRTGSLKGGESPMVRRTPRLSAGTKLLREWNGRTETVDVVADGFAWRGTTYRTLSGVAVAITGTKWSGPKFFGLVPRHEHKTAEEEA